MAFNQPMFLSECSMRSINKLEDLLILREITSCPARVPDIRCLMGCRIDEYFIAMWSLILFQNGLWNLYVTSLIWKILMIDKWFHDAIFTSKAERKYVHGTYMYAIIFTHNALIHIFVDVFICPSWAFPLQLLKNITTTIWKLWYIFFNQNSIFLTILPISLIWGGADE